MGYPHATGTRATTPDDLYTTPPPWDIGRPQPAFATLAQSGRISGRILDAGCGTGEHTLMAAALGLDATGVDLAETALAQARHKAQQRHLTARFLRHDARQLPALGDVFDTVLDCGLFHIFSGDDRAAYAASLRSVLRPGGRYFMLGFSDREPGQWGPHRLTEDDITTTFTTGWRIDSLEPAVLEIAIEPGTVAAWLLTTTATEQSTDPKAA